MRKNRTLQTAMEERLRQSVPPLREPDPARVAEACGRIASAPPVSALLEPHTFIKPLLRVAACIALLAGVALLLRPAPQSVTVPALPPMTFTNLATLMDTQKFGTALASEADDLAADLVALTAVLNDRTLAILF